MTLDVFIGYDHRQPVSFTVLAHSIVEKASQPVAIHPLVRPTLPITREGLTPFTYSRFLVPHLMGYRGKALFLDIDMLSRGDIAELFELLPHGKAVAVVPHEGPLAFERASLMLFDCAHPGNRCLTPERIEDPTQNGLHKLGYLPPTDIAPLPKEWNHLVGYNEPNPAAKIVHFTQGVPAYPETIASEFAEEWMACLRRSIGSAPWRELMGNSVHAKPVMDRLNRVA